MIFVDTGYWIALFNARDELHQRAMHWASFLREPMVTTDLVLVETANYLTHCLERERLHTFMDAIPRTQAIEILAGSGELIEKGMRLHRSRPDKPWSLVDCVSFTVMEQRSIRRALAYDHHFEQAGFEALLRIEP
jgi:predicted nucleic acid-binding protein